MNKNFINFRTGLVKLPVIIAGVFFLSHPTVTHASENNNSVAESPKASQTNKQETENKDTSSTLSNTLNEDQSTTKTSTDTNNVVTNNVNTSPEENKETISNKLETSDNNTQNTSQNDNSKNTNKPNAPTGSFRYFYPSVEDNVNYDKTQDPNYDEEGYLKDTRRMQENYEVDNRTAYIRVENANYKGEIESLKGGEGSGAYIGKNYFLTAAHVIYDNNYPRQYLTGGYLIPGKHGNWEPFGKYKIKAFYVPDKYIASPLRKYDIGIIEVDPEPIVDADGHPPREELDELRPFNIKVYTDDLIGKKVQTQGYPIDKNVNSINQWTNLGTIVQKQKQGNIEYSMDNSAGQSGSPVYLEDNNDEIIAVHSYGTRGNKYGTLGTPITQEIYDWIQSILNRVPDSGSNVSNDNSDNDNNNNNNDNDVTTSDKLDDNNYTSDLDKSDNDNDVNHSDASSTNNDFAINKSLINKNKLKNSTIININKVSNNKTDELPKSDNNSVKPTEQPKSDDNSVKPTEQPKSDDNSVKPAEQPKLDDNSVKPAEQPKSDDNSVKPAEQPKSDDNSVKPAEQPKSDDNSVKPTEQPKPHNASKLASKATQINNTDKAVNVTQVTTSQPSHEAKAETKSDAKQENKQLPKTGENEAIRTTLFGTLFAMLGSLLFFRKRKTDK
ncbi:trypsin-like serine protease [Mammaliicoccus sciuri]|uniref:trypsin-like serine protease n=1 Tax=Mammaliicoccus sciuri TaxID=1296 RepID=UPI002DBC7685|nr:trypsin-like serine protease [Mammaliicoccus sciuri]MEB7436881.1 trypsin-like serine protease [Mammaliicoccus sciuri]MEB7966260.1 trypsin-like serine protease [Mammaliicoccus sciuri]MEB8294850.1 trypsin-like serine protease [Mammaliicoccus sciuri]